MKKVCMISMMIIVMNVQLNGCNRDEINQHVANLFTQSFMKEKIKELDNLGISRFPKADLLINIERSTELDFDIKVYRGRLYSTSGPHEHRRYQQNEQAQAIFLEIADFVAYHIASQSSLFCPMLKKISAGSGIVIFSRDNTGMSKILDHGKS